MNENCSVCEASNDTAFTPFVVEVNNAIDQLDASIAALAKQVQDATHVPVASCLLARRERIMQAAMNMGAIIDVACAKSTV